MLVAAAHAWWAPCENAAAECQAVLHRCSAQKPAECRAVLQWDRCKSCEERLYDIYRFQDMSYCRQCREEVELDQETSDEEEGARSAGDYNCLVER